MKLDRTMTEKSIQQLQIFRRQSSVTVLGPYQRAVIWVQGCHFACQSCIVPESWDTAGGEAVALPELVDWILAQPTIEGITFSGGEPMGQSDALLQLVDQVRRERDLGIVCYTGYRLEQLQQTGTRAQQTLLQRIDLLIDGVYQQAQHGDYLWRGSANQRLLLLTDRYQDILAQTLQAGDLSVGLEFVAGTNGELWFTGIPAQIRFRAEFEQRMQKRGIILRAQKEQS